MGHEDPGRIGPLLANDLVHVVVFDADAIARGEELPARDMPEGGMRYVRSARGVDTVVVNGEVASGAAGGYPDARPGVIASA